MHVCICRNFNDAAVRQAIAAHPEASEAKDIYEVCSGGEKPQCGKCLTTIRDIRGSYAPVSAIRLNLAR